MKKLFLFAGIALAALTSCNNDDIAGGGNGGGNGEVDAKYLSINIMSSNAGTRADNDYKNDYEDGYAQKESDVKEIYFYFFDAAGNPAIVDFGTGDSYKVYSDVKEGEGDFSKDGDKKPNIENIRKATLIIQTKNKEVVPSQVLVVINPNQKVEAKNLSLAELREQLLTAAIADVTGEDNGFLMTNSTYVDAGVVVDATQIKTTDLKESADAAEEEPVEIYVERVVAKVNVTVPASLKVAQTEFEGEGAYYDTQETLADGTPILVQFLGWNVTTTSSKSNLVKQVNAAWNNEATESNLFKTATQPWYYTDYFRSFWGINPSMTYPTDYQFGNYDGTDVANNVNPAQKYTDFEGKESAYLYENAAVGANSAATADPSQVIISAKLVNGKTGDDLQLAEFAGLTYVDEFNENEEDSYTNTKTAILNQIKTKYSYLTVQQNGNATTSDFKQIDIADIVIVTATEAGKAPENVKEGGRYYVYAMLSEKAENATWFDGLPAEDEADLTTWMEEHQVDADAVNEALTAIGSAKIWKEGATYYFFNIRHLSAETNDPTTPGYYGVVRNHVYQCNVVSLKGLGTPVYKPGEVIIPEKPNEEEAFLAARINVLSWRIVNNDYTLDW